MKRLLYFLLLAALTPEIHAQTRWADLPPQERAAKIQAVREARRQRIRATQIANRQKARQAGRVEARMRLARDRALHAVWNRLAPEVQAMYAARELTERLSRRPEWATQTRAERIAAVTDFITNYPTIKAARHQENLDAAIGTEGSAYPDLLTVELVARVLNAEPTEIKALRKAGEPVDLATGVQPPSIAEFPDAETPDAFTINRLFNWDKPHGQWMNQMLKDIDAAKAAGDTETYEALTERYAAWADKYLRRDE